MWKVLIADDEKLICRLVQALVDWESLDMHVEATAENGLDALRLIKEHKPDILITDIRMPGCNGLELIQQAKELQPDLEIVIISGYAHFEYAQSAIAYGVGNYLLKPIKQDELIETLQKIREHLEEKRKWDDMEQLVFANRKKDLKRDRESMLSDIVGRKQDLSLPKLNEVFRFVTEGCLLQAFVLKIDCEQNQIKEASAKAIREKAKELFHNYVMPACEESVFDFQGNFGYGIVNYRLKNKDAVRKQLREFLKQLEGYRYLVGRAFFTLALGSAEEKADLLINSMENAKKMVSERLIEGNGKMLEGSLPTSGISKQSLIEKYAKAVEHAIEVLDVSEIYHADDKLFEAMRQTDGIRGWEILDIVLSAGDLFLLRTGPDDKKKSYEEFEDICMQCETVDKLSEAIKQMQGRMFAEMEQARGSESSKPVRIAKQYILQNFNKNISLEEVCEYVGFSVTYFSALFKKETGEGFAKYLTKIRMEEAKNLLRETGMPVAEICERVGYNDRKHFTHTFHKYTGVNPAEYRKLYG
ncbi:MAG: response regulator [Lachnospiraceae bacterium]|nr:response regulator [Lachnospiraceae bacterium]